MNILTANIHRVSATKLENDSILIIHPNAPVTGQFILQPFKLVSWTLQVAKSGSGIEDIQFANKHDQMCLSTFLAIFVFIPL
jgi:hypothetical protein